MADISLFGFQILRNKKQQQQPLSVVSPASDDGSLVVSSSSAAYYSAVIDLDATVKNENEMIRRYRDVALHPECDAAIEEIVNEAISTDSNGSVVSLNLEQLKVSDAVKKKIQTEFEELKAITDFDVRAHDLFRNWYIDGRQYHIITVDPSRPKDGILKVDYVDSRKIRKIKKIEKTRDPKTGVDVVKGVEEYYVYNEKGVETNSSQGIKLSVDSVVYIPSGLLDQNSNMMLSYLHKTIKPVNNLKMLEDAVVINTVARAPERRIFYIDVGNLPKVKAEQYVSDIMNKYRNKITYNATTGEVTDDRQHHCLVMDTKVPLLDGRTLTIAEIAAEYKDKQLWAYSCDPVTGKFVPGLITWAGVSRPNAQVMRITLDNGEEIICTPDHRFPVWDKNLVAAENLVVGDSMIPFYRRHRNITVNAKNKEYEQIFDNEAKEWVFTHRAVSQWKDSVGMDIHFTFLEKYKDEPRGTVHHRNINRLDNSPENLVRMNSKDHWLYHRHSSSNSGKIGGRKCADLGLGFHNKNHPDYHIWHVNAGKAGGAASSALGKSQANRAYGREILAEKLSTPEFNEWFRKQQSAGWTPELRENASKRASEMNLSALGNEFQKAQWQTPERKQKHREKYSVEYSTAMYVFVSECARFGLKKADVAAKMNLKEELLSEWKRLNSNKCLSKKQKSFDAFIDNDISKIVRCFDGITYAELCDRFKHRNHKIAKIEYLEETVDTGCLTIDGDEKYHGHHTFALEAGIYSENSLLEDYWMPRREGGKGTEITTLQGSGQLLDNDTITYFQQKLYQSLNVPVARLQPQQNFSLGRSNEITRDELKFNKFVSRLRNRFSQLLIELLRVQLIAKNVVSVDDWCELEKQISVEFVNDNNFVEMRDSELWMNRFQMLNQVVQFVGTYVSPEWVKREILKLTEEQIKELEKENKKVDPKFLPPEQQPDANQ